jgi:hypothetical protein
MDNAFILRKTLSSMAILQSKPVNYVFNHDESFDGFSFGLVEVDELLKAVSPARSASDSNSCSEPCHNTSAFPSLWKIGVVVPFPKANGSIELKDFRPI